MRATTTTSTPAPGGAEPPVSCDVPTIDWRHDVPPVGWPGLHGAPAASADATPLPPHAVRVWAVRPDAPALTAVAAHVAARLSAERRARLAALRDRTARDAQLAAHALLRLALTDCVPHVAPDEWRLSDAAGRPPAVLGPVAGLHVSLAHADGLVACAVAWGRAVGVDVERLPTAAVADAVARRLHPRAQAALAAAPPAARPAACAELWTLAEAWLKARGTGLRGDPARVAVLPVGTDGGRALATDADGWTFHRRAPTPDHRLALCLAPAAPARVRAA